MAGICDDCTYANEGQEWIKGLQALTEEVIDLLETIFTAYEDGLDCYEDPENCSGHLGKAIKISDSDFHRIADILNKYRPR